MLVQKKKRLLEIMKICINENFNFLAIDYKLLTNDQPKLVEAVMPAVFNNEISQVVNFLLALPPELKQLVNFEEVLEQLAEKIFFNGVSYRTD